MAYSVIFLGLVVLLFLRQISVQGLDIADVRLQGFPYDVPNAGRLQVDEQNQWKDVCHDGSKFFENDWSIDEAMVACRQLGYPGTAMSRKGGFGNGNSNKAVDGIECNGNEATLDDCSSHDRQQNCGNGNDAGVICTVPGYLGCYVDDGSRVLPDAQMNDNMMTIKKCRDFCTSQTQTMRYAGVESEDECFCGIEGTDYGRLGIKWDNECDDTCKGNPDEICGGYWRISIYDLLGGKCSDPSPQHGSTVEQDFSFGKTVTLVCDSDYELIGATTLQCILGDEPDNCTWSGETPQCKSLLPPPTTSLPTTPIISSTPDGSTSVKTSSLTTTSLIPITSATSTGRPTYLEPVTDVSQSTQVSRKPSTSTPTKQNTTQATRTALAGSQKPQQNGLSIGTISGLFAASLLALILVLLLLVFAFRPRTRHIGHKTSPTTKPLQFDGPYDIRIEKTQYQPAANTESPMYTQVDNITQQTQPIYANSDPTDPASPSEIYQSIPESTTEDEYVTVYSDVDNYENGISKDCHNKNISVAYSKRDKEITDTENVYEESSLYYAKSDSVVDPSNSGDHQDPDIDNGQGWEDNAAYSSLEDNDVVAGHEYVANNANGAEMEGWQENALYSVDNTENTNEKNTEWLDNTIYAGPNDQE